MNKNIISIVNGIEIVSVDRDGEIVVPVKPICEAMTLNNSGQIQAIKRHKILSSVVCTVHTTGADGKQYEMTCLPLKYVYGWLFNIDANQVAENRRDDVEIYQRECYDVLYEHFTGSMQRTIETNNAEIELLKQINEAASDEKEAKSRRRKAEEALDKLRTERLNPQPSLF